MLSEQDQELLEAYLDDALSPAEVDGVSARLGREPALAADLLALREQRRVRAAVWESLEPSEGQANAFSATVVHAVQRRAWMRRVSRFGRVSGAAAACILVGVGSGWMMRGRALSSIPLPANVPQIGHAVAADASSPPNGQIQFAGQNSGGLPAGASQVELLDDAGNVLAVQKFNKLDEARHFAQDLGQVIERQQNVQDGHVTLVSDHF